MEDELERILTICRTSSSVSLKKLFSETATEDQAIITLFLALPFLLPLPLPGLSIPFGAVILILGLRMFLGKTFWLPRPLAGKTIPCDFALKLFSSVKPVLKLFSRWVKPRGRFFSKHPRNKRFSFLLIAFCGFLLLLPLPPGTNSPPAFTAAVLSLGVLEEDSVYLILGYLCFSLITILFLTLALWGYPQVIQWLGY